MKELHILHLNNFPILEQLQIEEALLRTDDRSFCIINEGSPKSIVMGISSKAPELIDLEASKKHAIPVIRRFSGGGCVIVDQKTLFVTFIFGSDVLDLPTFPEPIHRWSANFYKDAFGIDQFDLRENDYVIGNHKCGGNAQYIQRKRWLHHTSFLWDYEKDNMDFLLFPKKVPKYRDERSHKNFLCKLKDHSTHINELTSGIKTELKIRFQVNDLPLKDALQAQEKPHRKSTRIEM